MTGRVFDQISLIRVWAEFCDDPARREGKSEAPFPPDTPPTPVENLLTPPVQNKNIMSE